MKVKKLIGHLDVLTGEYKPLKPKKHRYTTERVGDSPDWLSVAGHPTVWAGVRKKGDDLWGVYFRDSKTAVPALGQRAGQEELVEGSRLDAVRFACACMDAGKIMREDAP